MLESSTSSSAPGALSLYSGSSGLGAGLLAVNGLCGGSQTQRPMTVGDLYWSRIRLPVVARQVM